MLINHFGAETQGFQGLVDQNDREKAYVPEKRLFMKQTFFSGGSGVPTHSYQRPNKIQCKSFTKQFLFLIFLVVNQRKPLLLKYIEIYLAITLQRVVQMT